VCRWKYKAAVCNEDNEQEEVIEDLHIKEQKGIQLSWNWNGNSQEVSKITNS
jgi:hypothetical protein